MPKSLFVSLGWMSLLLLASGCGLAPAPNPTPIIIVVTATPEGASTAGIPTPTVLSPSQDGSGAAGTALPPGTGTPGATDAEQNLKPTTVRYVLAKQDINIRSGPGTDFDIVGGVYAGQTAQVTGYQSADGLWWRVVCPTDAATHCWVSADPALTEPTTAPDAGATPTLGALARTILFDR